MAALSASTYGKASPVNSTEFADRVTASLENVHGALDTLDSAAATGGPVDQAAVNTLRKAVQDLGTLATDARQAAAGEAAQPAQPAQPGQDTGQQQGPAAAGTGTSGDAGARTTGPASASGSTGSTGSSSS